jgi:hypothetical protein
MISRRRSGAAWEHPSIRYRQSASGPPRPICQGRPDLRRSRLKLRHRVHGSRVFRLKSNDERRTAETDSRRVGRARKTNRISLRAGPLSQPDISDVSACQRCGTLIGSHAKVVGEYVHECRSPTASLRGPLTGNLVPAASVRLVFSSYGPAHPAATRGISHPLFRMRHVGCRIAIRQRGPTRLSKRHESARK